MNDWQQISTMVLGSAQWLGSASGAGARKCGVSVASLGKGTGGIYQINAALPV